MNRVAVIILNWNGLADTLKCLDSLIAQDYKNFGIVVVDNGSVDNSVEKLEAYILKTEFDVTLITNQKNLGFAGGANTGIRYALENKFDSIALFNNDAVADKKWLSSLVGTFANDKVGIATGLLLRMNRETIDSTGEYYSRWGLTFPRERDHSANQAPKAGFIFGATGGASLYRAELFKDIGLFDESFFVYYEDADVSFRAQLAGWRVYYTPRAIAYHKQGATSKKVPGLTLYHSFKNLPILFLKNVPAGLLLPVGIRFYLAYWLIVGNAVTKGNGGPVLRGVIASFFLGFPALVRRHKIQKNKRVSTAYIKRIMWNDLPPDQTGMRKFRQFFTRKP